MSFVFVSLALFLLVLGHRFYMSLFCNLQPQPPGVFPCIMMQIFAPNKGEFCVPIIFKLYLLLKRQAIKAIRKIETIILASERRGELYSQPISIQ